MALKYTITHNGSTWTSSADVDSVTLQNGSVTESITTAGTRVLHCAGKYVKNNLIIGAKTLNCAGKFMAGDVTIITENGGTSTNVMLDKFVLTDSGLTAGTITGIVFQNN